MKLRSKQKFTSHLPVSQVGRYKLLVIVLLFGIVGSVLLRPSQAATLTGDINQDGVVNLIDLSMLLSNWNKTASTTPTPTPPIPPPAPVPPPTIPPPVPTPPPVTPPATSAGVCPATGSNEAIPAANTGKFKVIFADDFCVNSATGSWGSDSDADKIVYSGNGPLGATKWHAYPKSYTDTYQKRPYRSDAVLSTHNGLLDFFVHPVDGKPAGANPSPLVNGVSEYQIYGRYAARFRVDTAGLSDYHLAWLLWPESDAKGACAESDFPEGDAAGVANAYHHNDAKCSSYSVQDSYGSTVNFSSGWHTYVQEWEPGVRRYFIDGRLIGTSTTRVYAQAQRWQLQTETDTTTPNNKSGHLLLDWAVVWKYQP